MAYIWFEMGHHIICSRYILYSTPEDSADHMVKSETFKIISLSANISANLHITCKRRIIITIQIHAPASVSLDKDPVLDPLPILHEKQ